MIGRWIDAEKAPLHAGPNTVSSGSIHAAADSTALDQDANTETIGDKSNSAAEIHHVSVQPTRRLQQNVFYVQPGIGAVTKLVSEALSSMCQEY